MAGITSYILKKRAASLYEWPAVGWFLLQLFIAVLGGVMLGLSAGMLSDIFTGEEMLSSRQFIFYFSLYLAVPALFVDILPKIKTPVSLFKPWYPVPSTERIKIELAAAFFRNLMVFFLLTEGFLALFSSVLSPAEIGLSFLFIMTVYGANRVLWAALTSEFRGKWPLTAAALLVAGVSGFVLLRTEAVLNTAGLLALILLINGRLFLYAAARKREKQTSHRILSGYSNSPVLNILFSKNMKGLVIMAYVFKILMAVPIILIINKTGKSVYPFIGFDWLFLSAFFPFMYFGYNFFGINRRLFFTHALRESNLHGLTAVFFKTMGRFLLFDAALFVLYMALSNQINAMAGLFYLTSTLMFLSTSHILGLRYPKIKEKYLSLDFTKHGNLTIDFRALLMGYGIMIVMLTTMLVPRYFYLLCLIYMAGSVLLFLTQKPNFRFISRHFYEKTRILK